MDIPIDARVDCTDGPCGHITFVILDPVIEEVTHIVVQEHTFPHVDRLVPERLIEKSTADEVQLRCSRAELEVLEPFTETEFLPSDVNGYSAEAHLMWPYRVPESVLVPLEHEHIPPGEFAVRREAQIEATDGPVGRVDEFLVDPANGHITHLIMREGHLWGQKDIAIPVSAIGRIEEDTVHLKLDKQGVEALPTIAIRR